MFDENVQPAPLRIVKGYSAAIIPAVQNQNPQAINRRRFSPTSPALNSLTLKAEEGAGVPRSQPLRVEEVVLGHRVVQCRSGRRGRRRRGHRRHLRRGFGRRRGRVADVAV